MKKENTLDTLLEPLEISRALRDHAIKHYGQANATPFGKRDVFEKLTEEPTTNPFYTDILNGMIEHQPDLSASQNCSANTSDRKFQRSLPQRQTNWGSVGLSIVLNGVVPQGVGYF